MTPTSRSWTPLTVLLSVALVLSLGPAASAHADLSADEVAHTADDLATGTDIDARCSIPCGRISPILSLDTEIKLPITAERIAELPETSTVKLRMYWDMEQEGPGVADDTEMDITTTISAQPEWLDASIAPATCTVRIVPGQAEYDVCDMTLTLTVKEAPQTVADIEAPNNRLMLFAISEETGTFDKSYGVKDMRFKDDGTLLAAASVTVEESPGVPVVWSGLLALALAASLVQRRRRDLD